MEPSRERDGVQQGGAIYGDPKLASMEPSRERDGVSEAHPMKLHEIKLQWSRRANATEWSNFAS